VEQLAVESLQEALARVRQEMLPLAGATVSELLLNPRTDPATLIALKNHFKCQSLRLQQPDPEYETALVLYYAAIASALVFHNQKITSHSDATVGRSLAFLKEQSWMAWELAELFGKACFGLAHSVEK
jgi:hypothetical protein